MIELVASRVAGGDFNACFAYRRYAFTEYTAPARWFIAMNFTVHSLMYSYYALRAMNYKVPRYVAMLITTLQLSQMVAGCAVNLWAYQVGHRLSLSSAETGSCPDGALRRSADGRGDGSKVCKLMSTC